MIIDFHTHIFPEHIAKDAIHKLEQENHNTAEGTGTLTGLKKDMEKFNVDYSVILPVMTKPSQFDSLNEYAKNINCKDGILSFGGIHPDCENIKEKLIYIKGLGLKGVKLHPDYQGPTYIDDERYIRIIRECLKLDLCVVIHAGLDVGRPIPIHCPPDKTYLMLKEVLKDCHKDSKIILAHMGGMLQWELVERLLVGQNVYFDLAYCNRLGDKTQMTRIIKNHGADKILYGTDYPWIRQNEMTDYIEGLPITQEEKELIMYKNATRLLELPY